MEGQDFGYSLWHGFYRFLTVFLDLLFPYHIGIMACVKGDHYPVCRWISGIIVSFQPDKDDRKLVLIWNWVQMRIFDLKHFIRYFEDW